ncbi:transposase [Micromonospora fulviviridis]|uniref:transposase n=1 Tax=Micromonospora fulviviridis TaxID=47860 RepID=UPI003F533391
MRLRATYTRDQGVRHMIAALDLATGMLHYRIRDRKRWREFLSFLKTLRRRWPDQRLYLILDNFSPHKHPEVRAWCAANQVDLVFLPPYASWLNWIEAEFAAVRYFALNGTDHRTHAEQDAAIGDYIRWRNQRARPKTGFATGSKTLAMVHGPSAGLLLLAALESDNRMVRHHRLLATRAHLRELAGEHTAAAADYREAARRATSLPERRHLTARAVRLTL